MNENEVRKMKRRAWVIMLIVFLAGIAMAWAQNKVVPVIDSVQIDLMIGKTEAGWISSIFCVMGIILSLPAAGMMRKFGVKKTGILAIGSTIIGTLIGIFAPTAALLMISRVIEGFGLGLISVLAPAVISMWFASEKRGLPMGIWGAWQMVAQAGTFLFAGSICDAFGGWKGMWWVGLILLVVSIFLYTWKVTPPPAEYNHADSEDNSINLFSVMKYRSVWMIALVAMFFTIACFGWATWTASYWSEVGGLDFNFANSIVGWVYIAEIFIVIFEGWLLDKIKSRKRFGIILALLYGVLLFFAFNVSEFAGILVIACIYPFLEGAICTVFWTICPQTTPDPRLGAAALAVMVIGLNIGMMLGAPIAGAMIENFGWGAASIVNGIAGLLCAVFFALIQLYNEKGEKIKG